uniref:non-ribosomal peptide synthetase n=1 Tax=Herbidospora sakaeratensis TaxID=564415 RepID=UPI0007824DE7|nr:non-ribosomal peptide synthetase [Herbidospora sakaeratensis]
MAVIHELFEERARIAPAAVALESASGLMSYADLNAAANRLARHLAGRGVRPRDVVGVSMPRGIETIVTMLATLKAGAAYLPLEPGLPADRLAAMTERARPKLIVSAPPPESELAGLPATDLGLPVDPDDLVYLPFTSGSTGVPKGIEVPHRAVPGFFAGTPWGAPRVALHHSAQSWDGHVLDVYPALLTGGRVVVCPPEVTDPLDVARLARDAGVTVLWLTATAFNVVVDTEPGLLAGVRWLLTGGETLSRAHVARARAALPGTRLVNGYGPSECTVFATTHEITSADGEIPIGRPVGDRRVSLSEEGEIHVGGPAVARGYLGDPRLTADRFTPDPDGPPGARRYRTGDLGRREPDGSYAFLGRADDQVKIRGFRVELGEVETALREVAGVRDAAVAVRGAAALGAATLVGYVVGGPAPAAILATLRARLLPAMVPSAIVPLDRLPLTRTGKVDRAALPAPARTADAPVTDVERLIAGIWREVFGVADVGRSDDFFGLGGHSLTATRTISRIRRHLDVDLPIRALYETPRLADLAVAVERARSAPPPAPLPPIVSRRSGRA